MENVVKNDIFLNARNLSKCVLLSSISCFSAIGEKARKSMPEWLPKCMKNHDKIDVTAALGDLFSDFKCLGEWRKKQEF